MDWKPQLLAEGLEFPEGPIYMGDGTLVFTQIRGARLSRYADGRVETIAHTGGGANGATLGPDAAYYVANNGGLNSSPAGDVAVGRGDPRPHPAGYPGRRVVGPGWRYFPGRRRIAPMISASDRTVSSTSPTPTTGRISPT